MDNTVEKTFAWQPLTPRGVAAFASAGWRRLLLVQFLFALLAAAVAVWFVSRAWFPVVTAAVDQLPAAGGISAGSLVWSGDSPRLLAEGHFLAVAVDLNHGGVARSPAHLQVEFGRHDCWLLSVFGVCGFTYSKGWSVAFNRPEVAPWWGAWQPVFLAFVAGGVGGGLLVIWQLLTSLYALPVWLWSYFVNRDLRLPESRRLAGAALMPGALFMSGAILVYGLGALDLPRLVLAGALHLMIGWGYLALSPLSLPLAAEASAQRTNPFATVAETPGTGAQEPPTLDGASSPSPERDSINPSSDS